MKPNVTTKSKKILVKINKKKTDKEEIDNYESIRKTINATGRVPPVTRTFLTKNELETHKKVYGLQAMFMRITGKFEGTAVFQDKDEHSDSCILRIDSLAFPELWINVSLSKEQITEAYNMFQEKK